MNIGNANKMPVLQNLTDRIMVSRAIRTADEAKEIIKRELAAGFVSGKFNTGFIQGAKDALNKFNKIG